MISTRLLSLSFFATALSLCACNDSGDKSATDKTGADSATASSAPEPVAVSTIVTTPQGILMVKHKVADFAKWKLSYDAHDSLRAAAGVHNYVIGRSVDDSNLVMVAVKADDMTKAKAFAADPSLKAAMQKGGVVGKPSFAYLMATFQDTVTVNTPLRSLTSFTVKDWPAWEKGFAEGRQERIDNGITDRVYGHDPNDDKKVMLVTAIIDTAKASAYWKSDMLKKRRAASGVNSVPDRFVFRIVQRY